jgi:ubiquinone/menaquinone biosynthesis C-methylase UbiE
MINKKCIICEKKALEFEINLPVFEHQNLRTISLKTKLFKCLSCQIIFRDKKINYNFFKNIKYINGNNDHKLLSENKKIKTRSEIVAENVSKIIKKKKNLHILEVGCGKGYLLHELSKKYKSSTLYGYDVGNYSKFSVFKKKNFFFLNKKKFTFKENSLDLIVVSHTLGYFLSPLKEIKKYKKFLKKEGFLLILAPNIQKNIFYTLMADQKTLISETSLHNLLSISGFSNLFIKNKNLPREIICFSRPSVKNKILLKKNDKTLEKNLNRLNSIKQKILKIKSNNISILGTNVNSAFVDQVLQDKAKNFVSDFYKKNKFFRAKKVIGRNNLVKSGVLINCITKKNNFLTVKTKAKIINIF